MLITGLSIKKIKTDWRFIYNYYPNISILSIQNGVLMCIFYHVEAAIYFSLCNFFCFLRYFQCTTVETNHLR